MNEDTGQLLAIRDLCKKIVNSRVADMPLIISGSAPLDLILQRVPKDLDVYYLSDSNAIMTPHYISTLLSWWGVGGGLNNTPLNIQVLDNEYGTHTLKYDVTGQYRGFPVQIQFISVNSERFRRSLTPWSTVKSSLYALSDIITNSFPVNTSQSVMFLTEFDTLAVASKTDFRLSQDNLIHLSDIRYTDDAAPALIAKCIDKYMQYCNRPFAKVSNLINHFIRTVVLPEGSTKCVMLHTCILSNEVLINAAKTFDSLPDPKSSTKSPKEYMPYLSGTLGSGASSFGSLPSDWASPSRVTQELQSAGEQSQRTVPTFRGAEITERTASEFVEFMARTTASIPSSRSSDLF